MGGFDIEQSVDYNVGRISYIQILFSHIGTLCYVTFQCLLDHWSITFYYSKWITRMNDKGRRQNSSVT